MSKADAKERQRIARSPFITIGAALGCSISVALIVLVLLFFIIIPGRHNSRKTCQAALDVRDAVSYIVADAKMETKGNQKAQDFYDRALVKLNNVRCRT